MTRFDHILFVLGPALILALWVFLPGGRDEGARLAGTPGSGVVAELVGYALEARDDEVLVLGRSAARADVRLHQAPVASTAALLKAPREGRSSWMALPAHPDLTLRLLNAAEDRIRETSLRPWAEDPGIGPVTVGCAGKRAVAPVRLRQLEVWGEGERSEPELLWLEEGERTALSTETGVQVVACESGRVFYKGEGPADDGRDPCTTKTEAYRQAGRCWVGRSAVCLVPFRHVWGARVTAGEEARLVTPWSPPFRDGGLGLTLSGTQRRSIRLGVDAEGFGSRCDDPFACTHAVELCPVDGATTSFDTLGPLALENGDLLAMGRTRFLVLAGEEEKSHRLTLLHVRSPRSAGFFKSSSGHDVYHPNRQALWAVPRCEGQEDNALNLVVRLKDDTERHHRVAADLIARDRERKRRIQAAALHQGVPHEIIAVHPFGPDGPEFGDTIPGGSGLGERGLLSLCAQRRDRGAVYIRMIAASARPISLRTAEGTSLLTRDEATEIALGSAHRPGEVLVTMDGNLIRLAPAAGRRVTERTRLGLAGYLIFVLILQAVPLTRARALLCHDRHRVDEARWPGRWGAPTLQQIAGVAMTALLFVGASYQLFLALHPELAGKPDYLQAFLLAAVLVSAVLAAAAGFVGGGVGLGTSRQRGRAWRNAAGAALGGALALLGAAVWWFWDGWGVPRDLWLTALRDQATASSSATPRVFFEILLYGGVAGLVLALLFALSGLLPWQRWLDGLARAGVRFPVLGFAVLAAVGLGIGILQSSALACEIGILAGLAWYAAVYWSFVRCGRLLHDERLHRRAAVYSLGSGLLMLLFLVAFFLVGADLPDPLSFAFVALGLAVVGRATWIMLVERFTSLLRVLLLWALATGFGAFFAALVLTDMGSIAAWVPALLTGLFLWLVRPEEQGSRTEEPKKARSYLLLALGSGLLLLGMLDVFKVAVGKLEWQVLERPRQRLDLAEDVSYITAGEWITEVRWLASQQNGDLRSVAKTHPHAAIFGLASGVGTWLAVLVSILVLTVAGSSALVADQALREGYASSSRMASDRLLPVLFRALGLFLGMISVLLIAQWLVHLATGVVLHLPITGLVFPWLSHGNTTHLLYAAAAVAPMAAVGTFQVARGVRTVIFNSGEVARSSTARAARRSPLRESSTPRRP